MIPKVIHYCWFGGNPKPELLLKCIESWKKYCPDYEIIEWNESNYDINKNAFMKEAYRVKKWGFVPDYARFDIIYQNGGFYMDTDVELFCSLDDLCKYDAVFAFETARNIACGLGFGAEKGNSVIDHCLDYYRNRHFINEGKMDQTPSPRINTESLLESFPSLKRTGLDQVIDNTLFMSHSYYSQYMKHHYAGTWVDNKDNRVHIYKPSKIKDFLRDPSKYDYIESRFGKNAVRKYEFLTYDLLEYGIWYYVRRAIKKQKG